MSAAPQPIWQVGDPAPQPLPRRSVADVMARWKDGPPLVSILCATYQHVDFIEDALRGFLGQDTDFPFEVIVRDDASTDGTAEIVRDYAERYQGVVRGVLEPVNRFADLRPLTVLRSLARASVLAACEGDDYWSSPDKLQRQLEVLQAFPDASVVSHAGIAIRDELIVRGPQGHPEGVIPRDELLSGTTMSPRTMCFRATYAEAPEWESRMPAGDRFLVTRLGEIGYGVALPDVMAVYREHAGGVWSQQGRQTQAAMMAVTHFWIGDYFIAKGERRLARLHLRKAAEQVATAQLGRGVDPRLRLAFRLLRGWPRTTVRLLIERLRRLVQRG